MNTPPNNPKPENKVSLQQFMENFCDLTDWEIVIDEYRKREIESRAWHDGFIRDILAKYPNGISSPQDLRADHRYSLISYLEDGLQKASFYGVNPEGVDTLFVQVKDFYGISLTQIVEERREAAKYVGTGTW